MMKKFNNRENECVFVDGKEIWVSRSVAVVATIMILSGDDMLVLLAQRGPASPTEVGKWNLPCGYLDWDETGTEAAKRELWEETGFFLDDYGKHMIYNRLGSPWRVNTDPKGAAQNVSLHYGAVFDFGTKNLPKISNINALPGEVSSLGWFLVKNIGQEPSINEIAFNHNKTIKEFYDLFKNDIENFL